MWKKGRDTSERLTRPLRKGVFKDFYVYVYNYIHLWMKELCDNTMHTYDNTIQTWYISPRNNLGVHWLLWHAILSRLTSANLHVLNTCLHVLNTCIKYMSNIHALNTNRASEGENDWHHVRQKLLYFCKKDAWQRARQMRNTARNQSTHWCSTRLTKLQHM